MTRNGALWALLPILLFSAGFGFAGAASDALWFDEFWSLYNAGLATYDGAPLEVPLTPIAVWRQVATYDPIHPPGYALLLLSWRYLVGGSVFAGRVLSALLGVLSLACVFAVGRIVISCRVGLFGAYLLGTSAFYVHYTHELRMYTLLLVLVCMTLWGYWRFAIQSGRWFAAAIFVVGLAGLVYTQYLSVFVIVGIGIYHLLFAPKTRRWGWVGGLAVFAGLLYLPWIGVVWELFTSVSGGVDRAGVLSTVLILRWGIAILTNSLLQQPSDWILSFVPVAVGLLVWGGRFKDRGWVFLWVVLLVTGGLMLAINAVTGMFIHIRYLLVMFPAFVLVLSVGMERIPAWAAGLILIVWVGSGWSNYNTFEAQYNRDQSWVLHWQEIATALNGITNGDDLVVVQAAQGLAWWDYAQVADYYLHDIPASVTVTPLRRWERLPEYQQQLTEQIVSPARIFYVVDLTQFSETVFEDNLPPAYQDCGVTVESDTVRITVFALTCGTG